MRLFLITMSILITACNSIGAVVSAPIDVPGEYNDMTVSADMLNVRDSPGGIILSYLIRGDIVTVYAIEDGWCRITPNEEERWVYCKWLK